LCRPNCGQIRPDSSTSELLAPESRPCSVRSAACCWTRSFEIGCCIFWLPSGRSPARARNLPSSFTFRSTLRLASAISLRLCLPTQLPTLIDCQTVRLAISSTSNLRWRSNLRPAFQPTIDLRLRLAFWLNLRINLRPAPPADPSVCLPTHLQLAPLTCLPANPPIDFRLAPSFNLPVPPSNLTFDSRRPLIPSALPSSQPTACAANQPFGPA